MIKKWRNRFIIYLLITAFLAVIGYYLYMNIEEQNDRIEALKGGEIMLADLSEIQGNAYTDTGAHRYMFSLTVDGKEVSGVTMSAFTKEEVRDMGGKVEVYVLRGENIVSAEKKYVDTFVPWVPAQSIFLWVLGGITFCCSLYYIIRNVIILVVLKKGETSIGTFEEAFHSKLGSNKYYKVRYNFIRDGESAVGISPAYYIGSEVDKLKSYGTFNVKYLGKISVIDQKL